MPNVPDQLISPSRPEKPNSVLSNRVPAILSSTLAGKRAAMVVLSPYPFDPRPRRAADTLTKEGMQVDYICICEGSSPKRETHNGINVRRISIEHKRAGKLAYVLEYLNFLISSSWIVFWQSLRHRYDLVYVHNMPNALVLCGLIPRLFGAKIVLDVHDPMPELMVTIFGLPQNSLSVRLTKMEEKWSMWLANAVITVNDTCKKIFGLRSCPEKKIKVVMNSPDESIFPSRTPESYITRAACGSSPFVVMYHGSLVDRNGLDLAIEAFPKVLGAVPNAELRIYGKKTPFLEQVLNRARELKVEHAIHFLGPKLIEDLVPAIEACNIGVIPNHKNLFTDINTPTRIFEYAALGKPVVAPSTPGIKDYFDESSIFFFESGNAEQLADQLIAAARDPERALRVAVRAQQVYKTHTWSQERKTLVQTVAALLQ